MSRTLFSERVELVLLVCWPRSCAGMGPACVRVNGTSKQREVPIHVPTRTRALITARSGEQLDPATTGPGRLNKPTTLLLPCVSTLSFTFLELLSAGLCN